MYIYLSMFHQSFIDPINISIHKFRLHSLELHSGMLLLALHSLQSLLVSLVLDPNLGSVAHPLLTIKRPLLSSPM